MSDSDLDLISPEEPWITQDGLVIDAFPAAVDVEKMADPTKEGDVPDPSPIKSKSKTKMTDEEKWDDYLEKYNKLNKLKNTLAKKLEDGKKKFKKANPNASIEEKKDNLRKRKKQLEALIQEIKTIENSIEKPTVVDMSSQLEGVRKEINLDDVEETLAKNNPQIIIRNHIVEYIIEEILSNKYNNLYRLLEAMEKPFEKNKKFGEFYATPSKKQEVTQTFCGT